MWTVLRILFGALFTWATAYSLGRILFQRLHLRFSKSEDILYSWVAGAALLSLAVFALCASGILYPWSLALLGAVSIGAAAFSRSFRISDKRLPDVPMPWGVVFWICFAVYGTFYAMNALAPEHSPDGSAYHLGLVSLYLRQHGFGRITTNMYANLSMGIEMLFVFAFAFGRHSAAATTHFLFYLTLPLMILTIARREGFPVAGVIGALLVMLSPVVGADGSSAYIDVGMSCVVFTLFCILTVWKVSRDPALLIVIGLLAGFSYAAKLTAFLAIPYAFGYVLWNQFRSGDRLLRPLIVLSLGAAFAGGPWLIKNAVIVGNPFSPFLNRYFPNPNVRISFEEEYVERQRHYEGITSAWDLPFEATVRGGALQGLLGPAFLLLPLGVFAARHSFGRRLIFAGLVFGSTYVGNAGSRFLLAALPFLSLALGIALTQWRGMGACVLAFHIWTCWPSVTEAYCAQYAWRVPHFLWKAAFRSMSDHDFLSGNSGGYLAANLVNDLVPPDGKVLTFGGAAEAYCRRTLLVAYQAGFNNTLGDILATGMIPDYQPLRRWTFSFSPRPLSGVRVVQTEQGAKGERWTIAEIRVYSRDGEVQRNSDWRLRANPNTWEVQMAFDACPITRWNTWQRAEPEMFIEARFGKPATVSEVTVDLTSLQPNLKARIEGETSADRWEAIAPMGEVSVLKPVVAGRRLATDDLKRMGITHLLASDGDFASADLFGYTEAWGITYLGAAGGCKLYKLN